MGCYILWRAGPLSFCAPSTVAGGDGSRPKHTLTVEIAMRPAPKGQGGPAESAPNSHQHPAAILDSELIELEKRKLLFHDGSRWRLTPLGYRSLARASRGRRS